SGLTPLGLGSLAYSPGPANESAQTLTYTVTVVPLASIGDVVLSNGTTVVTGSTTYTLTQIQGMKFRTAADGNGTTTFTFTVQDNGATADGGVDTLTQSVTVTVTAVDDNPVAVGDSATVTEDSVANEIDVLANDYDVDNQPASNAGLVVTAVGSASHGTSSL